jgi:hypothetical protein
MVPGGSLMVIVPAAGDPIRIVPLHVPDDVVAPTAEAAAAAQPPPHLVYNGGPLIQSVEVFTIFWGTAWQQQQSGLAQTVNQFFDFILTSPLIDQLTEYNVQGKYTIGHGRRVGTITITHPAPQHSVTDAGIRHMLQQEISTNPQVPQPSANSLYFIYVPPGVRVIQGGAGSCQAFCGYHDDISGQIFYAVMPYPGCGGCTGGMTATNALTSTSSHELCEAITDPIPGRGWYDQVNGEIGDICAWKTKMVGQYTVQQEWSNQNNRCM